MRITISVILLLLIFKSNAQEEIASFFYPKLLQSGQINPAFSTGDRFNIGLASTYFHLDLRGPRIRDIANKNKYIQAFSRSVSGNSVSADASYNYFDVSFRKNKWDFRLGMNSNFSGFLNFSPDLARIIGVGNAEQLGTTFDLGPEFFIRNTTELYLGVSVPIYEYYRLGVNLKFISGTFDVSTTSSYFDLETDLEFYALNFETDYFVNSSINEFDLSIQGLSPFLQPLQDNIGVSADFGLQYFAENWTVSASLLDVGWIKWRSNVKNYKTQGEYSFEGLTFEDFSRDSITIEWENVKELFDVEVSENSYVTSATFKFYLGGEYRVENWSFGGLVYSEWKQQRALPSFSVNVKKELWDFWHLGLNYSIKNSSFTNLGFASIMDLGPIQMYALTDNAIGLLLNKTRTKINFRLGMNINIGEKKIKKTDEIEGI